MDRFESGNSRDRAHADSSSERSQAPRSPSPGSRRSAAMQLSVLLFCVLFFQGCEKSTIRFTVGPFAPVVALDYNGDDPLASEFNSFAPHWLVLNLVLLTVLFLSSSSVHGAVNWVTRRELTIAVFTVAVLFNSVLVSIQLWQQAVLRPIVQIDKSLRWLLRVSRSDIAMQEFVVGLSSRIYFLICVAGAIVVWRLARMMVRRYVFTEPDRWWQVGLGPLMTITLVLGTAIGMLLRVFR